MMNAIGLTEIIIIAGICIGAIVAALWLLSIASRKPQKRGLAGFDAAQSACFLFEGERLIDATVSAYGLLGASKPDQSNWTRMHDILAPRFPDFPEFSEVSAESGQHTTRARDDTDKSHVLTEWWDGMIRVELVEQASATTTDAHKMVLLQQELKTLRQAVEGAPYPVWKTDAKGKATWTNTAYGTLLDQVDSEQTSDASAPTNLFDLNCVEGVEMTRSRTALNAHNSQKQHWYDVSIVRFGDSCMNYAIDVNAVVNAEIAQRNFVQTLTKTFAHLSIGLAIFDRNRQLALFNPALIDLTELPADFLSIRPNLLSFFDRLRDNRMMPEPKNYSSWRKQIADLVAAAADGHYFETWTLESGLTYRVSGRPHPDGAIAFLFEDISAEISLTQRFRAQLELGQSVLDDIEDSIAVFSSDGMLTLSNAAYQNLWGIDPESSFAMMTLLDAVHQWRDKCATQADWEELRDFIIEHENRSKNKLEVLMRNGKRYECRVSQLSGAITSVKFRERVPAIEGKISTQNA